MSQFLPLVVVLIGIFGTLIGSFLNVVVYRVPLVRSIVSPPSACPACGHAVRSWDNIPVLSWFVLRGKCRDCKVPISARYPLVELGTGLVFALVAGWALATFPLGDVGANLGLGFTLVALLYLAAISVALALIDLDTHTLPGKIVLPSYVVGAALLTLSSVSTGNYGQLLTAAIGLIALWLLYFLLAVVYPGGMGFGDVKLAGLLGLFLGWLGWGPLAVGAFGAFVLGGVFAITLLVTKRVDRKGGIPFGPWMLAGAWLGILAGAFIWHSYLASFGLA